MLVPGLGVLCIGPEVNQLMTWLDTLRNRLHPLEKELIQSPGLIKKLPGI